MTRKMDQSLTNDHESATEMIILSDMTMAAGFKPGIVELCPLLGRLLFSCVGLKMFVWWWRSSSALVGWFM